MGSIDFKKLTPHLLILAGFAVFSLLYAYPALQGRVLAQHDLMNWQGMYQQSKTYYDSTGINPLWTNSMFGGMPSYTIGYPHSNNYVGNIALVITSILVKPAYFFFIAMACFYALMSVMRIDRWIAVIGSFAYAFATNTIVLISVGHETKVLAMGWLPAVLAGLILIYRQRWLMGSLLMGVSLALMIGTNHFQVFYYSFFVFGGYFISKLISVITEKGSLKNFIIATAVAIVVAIVSVGTCMSFILPTKEYAKVTMRGGESELKSNKKENKKAGGLDKDYAFLWSNGIGETFSMMIPYLYGGSSSESIEKAPETEALVGGQTSSIPLYWGPQRMGISGPIYFGAIVCFLFVLGAFIVKSKHKWWMLAVCTITIMMSWGDNFKAFNYFLFDHLPMYNKFRSPTMVLLVPQLLFLMLGMWGLMEIAKGTVAKDEALKKLKIAAGITAGLCLLFAFGGSMFFDYSNPAIDAQLPKQLLEPLKADRQALATKSALTSAVYILLAAGLLWAFMKDKINKNILVAGIGILVFIDLFAASKNYLNDDNYEEESEYEAAFTPRPVDAEILKDPDPYFRVLDLSRSTYNDAISAYHFKNIGGYSPAKMEIYQDLIDMQLGGVQTGGKFNAQVLNMLNAKYIIFQTGQQQQPVAFQPNHEANGNAWFVNEAKTVATADDEMHALNAPALGDTATMANPFNSKTTAVLRESYAKELKGYRFGKDSAASIHLTKYGLNDLSYVSNNSQDGLAVFSEVWYPYGWEATIDGKPATILRANYVLRALKIPAGKHEIAFHFKPKSYALGSQLTTYSNIILILIFVAALYFILTGKEKSTAETASEVAL